MIVCREGVGKLRPEADGVYAQIGPMMHLVTKIPAIPTSEFF
jgi:hypothetical protein